MEGVRATFEAFIGRNARADLPVVKAEEEKVFSVLFGVGKIFRSRTVERYLEMVDALHMEAAAPRTRVGKEATRASAAKKRVREL